MSNVSNRFEWARVNKLMFTCIVVFGIVLALAANLPFRFFSDYYSEKDLRQILSNHNVLQIIILSFGAVLTIWNSLIFCFREQTINSSGKLQTFVNILILVLETIVLFIVFFLAPRHQVDSYWVVPSTAVGVSLLYIILCCFVFKPHRN